MSSHPCTRLIPAVLAILLTPGPLAAAGPEAGVDPFDAVSFQDGPGSREMAYPDWFKHSFLDLREDVQEAAAEGRRLVVYFGQRDCAYCQALLEVNFGKADIVAYTRRHFDVVPIDIWSDVEVVDTRGERLSSKAFAEREKAQFTPTLIFYGEQGEEVFRLRGYYPPYEFGAALEYVADGHHGRIGFRDYLARAEPNLRFEPEDLVDDPLFARPPHLLDRTRFPAERPLAVFFEQPQCHACDILHSEQLRDPRIRQALEQFEVVQLDMGAGTPVLTPDGRRVTASQWARELGLFYPPTVLFFDENGREIIRVDSVVRFHRLASVLDFVLSKDYLAQPYFQRWREDRAGRTPPPGLPVSPAIPHSPESPPSPESPTPPSRPETAP